MDATTNAAAAAAKRTSLELSGDVKLFINRFGSGGDLPALVIPLELKILSALVMLFLFLLFLIAVLWDRYGKEIGELYTPGGAASRGDVNADVNVNDVADEYTVYQKLPTFFYEYTRKKRN
ncbi:hypothetical protein Gpo141_00009671 [Globisporangium polare]